MPLLILPNAFGDAATNMAVDASLLDSLPTGIAVFRHYGWVEPAITFGYTQRYSEIQQLAPEGVSLCRRLTGGGLVDHRNDWTYALILQAEVPVAQVPANSIYERIHHCIQQALEAQGIDSQLAPCPKACGEPMPPVPDQCFVQPVAYDVLTPAGQKIAGAAMKRTRSGLLIQGSIDKAALPENFASEPFKDTFTKALAAELEITIGQSDDIRSIFDGARIQQERERFQSTAWQQRR